MTQQKGYDSLSEFVKNKSISLIGIGVSNLPLVSFLYEAGANSVTVRDLKKTDDDPQILQARDAGAKIVLGDGYLSDLQEDIIIRSPVVRPDIPPFEEAKKRGLLVTCETELFLQFAPCKTVAITGSDGKTTTTTLVSKILSNAGYEVKLGGNIGKAMLPQLKEIKSENEFAVMELSSFQLMNCRFSPDVAIITNLSENHLDWHRDMDEYFDAKKNILKHQDMCGRAVLNFDNQHTKNCQTNGKKVFFSYEPKNMDALFSDTAVFCRDGKIFAQENGVVSQVMSASQIILPGKHNVENYMAAIAAVLPFVSVDHILAVAETFGGVEHRIELVREISGVKFYNSSIDSSPARSTACLRSFSNKIIMIAGGYDKNLDYSALGDEICEHVKTLILCGATAEKIRNATKSSAKYRDGSPEIHICKTFSDTVLVAEKSAEKGDCVVLSPASASFDLFRNFDERGKYFKKLVMEL